VKSSPFLRRQFAALFLCLRHEHELPHASTISPLI
jgi:hypothetical protein